MQLTERSWYPLASGVGWGLLVLVLVLVNSGSVVLALLVGAFVAVLSWRLALKRQDLPPRSSSEQ